MADGRERQGGAQYHCDYCRKDITTVVHIRCAVCADFDLCLECFSSGVAVYPHQNDHAYRVMDHVTTPIFDEDWGADEELLLLEAIELYGLGNWGDVADHVGSNKTKAKCEQHYVDTYLNVPTAPLPDAGRGIITKKQRAELEARAAAQARKKAEEVAAAASKPASAERPGAAALPLGPNGGLGGAKSSKRRSALANLVGYTPNRGDFDTEYDNEAEMVIADMEFKDSDTQIERELKLKVLDIYNARLDARLERKKFVVERGLLDPPRKRTDPLEREVEESLRPFARFHTAEEHKRFVAGVINERRLRQRIQQLQHYRLNGIRSLADADLYEAEQGALGPGASDEKRGRKRAAAAAAAAREAGKRQKAGGPLDVSQMEGVQLLSAQERKLCEELRLLPRHYLMIKEQLIRESFQRGFLQPGAARQLIRIDVNKTAKLYDFFVSVGWISATPPAAASSAAAAAAAAPAPASSAPAAP